MSLTLRVVLSRGRQHGSEALRPARKQPMLVLTQPFAVSIARPIGEPGVVVPHAGICEGVARQRAILP